MINFRIIFRVVGLVLLIFSAFMLIPALWAVVRSEVQVWDFLVSILITSSSGGLMLLVKPEKNDFGKRDGFLIVTLSWLTMCIAGMVPYMVSGVCPHWVNAFFESASGMTTTGTSIFSDIEALPESILLWRSLTQWLGGMGVIVLTVALLPFLGVSGIELFVAESPGPKSEKSHPRIKETAKHLWLVYAGMTVALTLILNFISGMSFFDAMNHSLTTMSTGGFSTKNDSIAHFDSGIVQYPIIIFMFLAGTNYTLLYFAFRGKLKNLWRNDEFRSYFFGVLTLIFIVSFAVHLNGNTDLEKSIRDAVFQVVSIVTTTGFVSADYTMWGSGMTMLFFFLLFTGACAGSTSGGIKVIRHLAFTKNAFLEFKRLLHPRAMIRMKIDGRLVPPKVLTHILVFLLVYLSLFVFGSLIVSVILSGEEGALITAFGAVASSLGNVGPAIGAVGPINNYADFPDLGKLFLSFYMIIGRLELFTVLIIFTPFFWKVN